MLSDNSFVMEDSISIESGDADEDWQSRDSTYYKKNDAR
jgi:hypothetical protein